MTPSLGRGDLTPWLRVHDLEYWVGSLHDINWEVIHSLAQHSGTPPLYQPQFQTQRLQEGPQGDDALESGAPRLPAYPSHIPPACNPRTCGLTQLIFGPNEVSVQLGWSGFGMTEPLFRAAMAQRANLRFW